MGSRIAFVAALGLVVLVTSVVLVWRGAGGGGAPEHAGEAGSRTSVDAGDEKEGAAGEEVAARLDDSQRGRSPVGVARVEALSSEVRITAVDLGGETVDEALGYSFHGTGAELLTADRSPHELRVEGAAHRFEVPAEGALVSLPDRGPSLVLVSAAGFQPECRWFGIDGEPHPPEHQFVLREAESIRGSVLDDQTGESIVGATVSAMPSHRHLRRDGQGLWRLEQAVAGDRVDSGDDGSFELIGLRDVIHELTCEHGDYATARLLVVEPGDEVEFRLCGPWEIHGFVEDTEGEPIEGAGVIAQAEGQDPPISTTGTTDENGEYRLEGLPSGPFLVHVYSEQHQYAAKAFQGPERARSLDFVLKPMVEFRGRVVDDQGVPVAGAEVGFGTVTYPKGEVGHTTTEDDGSWWMICIGEGQRIDVFARKEGYYSIAYADGVVAPQEDLVLVLPRDGRLTLGVLDPEAEPVPDFHVQVIHQADWEYHETRLRDADLWKTFTEVEAPVTIEALWPSRSEVRVQADGYEPYSGSVDLRPGEDVEVEVELKTAGIVTGTVLDPDGNGVEGASVRIAGADSRGRPWVGGARILARTAADGRFRLAQGNPRSFELLVEHRDHGLRVLEDQRLADYPRAIVLEHPGGLRGRVLQPWKNVHHSGKVRIRPTGIRAPRDLDLDEGGFFASGPLQPGAYEVELIDEWSRAVNGNHRPVARSVTVSGGQDTYLELDTTAVGRITGWLDAEGEGHTPDDYAVHLLTGESSDQRLASSFPSNSGRFAFQGIDPGDHVVQVVGRKAGILLDLREPLRVTGADTTVELHVPAPSLAGRVEDGEGKGLDAHVMVIRPGDPQRRADFARTDHEGRYRLILAEEDALLGVSSATHADRFFRVGRPSPESEVVHVLEPESRLQVAVRDPQGRPLPSAMVEVVVPAFPAPLDRRVSRAGHLADFTRLPAGRVQVEATSPGSVPVEIPVTLAVGQLSQVDLELVEYGRVLVELSSATGTLLRGTAVTLVSGDQESTAEADATGQAWFPEVPPGTIRLTAGEASSEFDLAPGQRARVQVSIDSDSGD